MVEAVATIVTALITAAASFGGAWVALKLHVEYLRKDVDALKVSNARAHERIERHERDDLIHVPRRQHAS